MVVGVNCLALCRSAAGQCFGPIIVPTVHFEHFSFLENTLIGYSDDSTLTAIVPSPGVRVTVAESLIRVLGKVNEWCNLVVLGQT